MGTSFNEVLSEYGIVHVYTTPNQPTSNGLAERSIRTLVEILRVETASEYCEGWLKVLPKALITYNHTFHAALERCPAEYIIQKEHGVASSPLIPDENLELWKEGNPSFGSFSVGQKVLKKRIFRGNLATNKFLGRFQGPYEVTRVHNNGVTYVIRDCRDGEEIWAHHSQLRRYIEPPGYLLKHPSYF